MPADPGQINVFSDGSKSEIGSVAAYILKGHSIELQEYFNLGEHVTIFQAEIFASNKPQPSITRSANKRYKLTSIL